MRCACALSPARFVLVCDACARSSVHTLGHNSWQPGGDRGRAHQCDPGHIHTLRGSEGGHPCARREVIHALQGRPSTRSGKVIHALQGRRSTRCSTRSKGGDPRAPREVIHALRGRSPQAPRELITALKEGRSPRASGEVIHALQGRPSTRSRVAIHAQVRPGAKALFASCPVSLSHKSLYSTLDRTTTNIDGTP